MKFQVAQKQNFELFNEKMGNWRKTDFYYFLITFDVEISDYLYILIFNAISKSLIKT